MVKLEQIDSQVYTKVEIDDYAISFAEWRDLYLSDLKIHFDNYTKTTKELLEIFKKENKL